MSKSLKKERTSNLRWSIERDDKLLHREGKSLLRASATIAEMELYAEVQALRAEAVNGLPRSTMALLEAIRELRGSVEVIFSEGGWEALVPDTLDSSIVASGFHVELGDAVEALWGLLAP